MALGFEGFEWAMHHCRDLLWHDLAGDRPGWMTTIALTTIGGAVLGIALRLVPGHGGQHPAEGHSLLEHDTGSLPLVAGVLVVGFVGLVAGASLGPEGAIIPAAAGISILVARWSRIPGLLSPILPAAGLAALLAAMFGSPLAGVVPLLEMIPSGGAMPLPLLVLPSLTASATAALTLQVLGVHPEGYLPIGRVGFERGDLLWAVVIGVVIGSVGLFVDRIIPLLRSVTRRVDRTSVVATTTIGGIVLGVLYVIGGTSIRFAGIPELLQLTRGHASLRVVLVALGTKVLATAWCVAAGYRGGKIFPVAFIGGAGGLALHLIVHTVPIGVAVGGGIAAALATGLGSPVTAALVAASVLGPELLPIAIVCVVCSHATHLLADQLAPATTTH